MSGDPLKMLLALGGKGPRGLDVGKQAFPGSITLSGDRPTYDSDRNAAKLTSIPVAEVTAVKCEVPSGRTRGKRVASNLTVRCYAMKNFLRCVDMLGEHRVLLRGHEAPVVDVAVRLPAIFVCCRADYGFVEGALW